MEALGALPDDAVLAVLSQLPIRDLLQCRLVCHRLHDLAMHPDLWRHRRITGELLALKPPCCGTLCLRDGHIGIMRRNAEWAATTACAAERLEMLVNCWSLETTAMRVIHRQAQLGRLTSLSFETSKSNMFLFMIFALVYEIRGLRELRVCVPKTAPSKWEPRNSPPPPPPPSLRKIACDGWPGYLLPFLCAHATTLEVVELGGHVGEKHEDIAQLMLTFTCPWELNCRPNWAGLDYLTCCTQLTALTLVVDTWLDYHKALNFLSSGSISRLRLDIQLMDRRNLEDLIETLGRRKCSAKLTSLDVTVKLDGANFVQIMLQKVLPKLSQLRKLSFNGALVPM